MIAEAGLVSFLRTLLIFVAVYYIIRFVGKLLLPWLLKYVLKKQFSSTSNFNSSSSQTSGTKDAEKRSKSKKEKLGEYVEYEEIKEDPEKD